MSGQLSLAGFDAPRKTTDRLFFAILPDAETAGCIDRLVRDLRAEHGLKGKPLGIGRYHVTLHHVGDFAGIPLGLVDAAGGIAHTVTAVSPFRLCFDRVASFSRRPRNMPLVLLGDEDLLALRHFQHALSTSMANAGISRDVGSHYTPHLTLLYDDRHVAEQAIEPIAWTACELVLVHSLIGQGRHEALVRLPLRG